MTWTLAPALKQLMNEVNAAWPNRSREWDGTIGDYLHSLTTSEHNPYDEYGKKDPDGVVRAVDITAQGIDVPTLLGAAIGDPRVHYRHLPRPHLLPHLRMDVAALQGA